MSYIKGKYKQSIYENGTGYYIGLFKVIETDEEDIKVNKLITITGAFASDFNKEDNFILYGNYIFHNRYGYQFQVSNYEKVKPEGKDAIIEFLTSSFVKGCGEATAKAIYKLFKEKTLEKIKENKDNLLLVPKMTEKKANTIYNSVKKYFDADKEIVELKKMGFTVKETMDLLNSYGKKVLEMINNNVYIFDEMIDFKKLDNIFLAKNDKLDERRIKACIKQTLKILCFENGDIYLYKEEILTRLFDLFEINIDDDKYFNDLFQRKDIMIKDNKYYLMDYYLDELYNAKCIKTLKDKKISKIKNFINLIEEIQKELNIVYNSEQTSAIKTALENNISIITGGPGTGKTTIIKGILKMYEKINSISTSDLFQNVSLLAPTGRASKRMSESCLVPASTIHRFLKWDKENNIFGINENNQLHYNLFIIDEVSMIDNHLLASLFRGIDLNTKIIFVGDEYQLPSVGPGSILKDMIESGINHIKLNQIYRQSENSFIPYLAENIRKMNTLDDYKTKTDDYAFIESSKSDIKEYIKKVVIKMMDKNIDLSSFQILAPMYKGENGIDNLNIMLQELINPESHDKNEVRIGPIIYRENDKILNLVNDIDNNIYNGDFGIIDSINLDSKSDYLIINYYGNRVSYKKEDIKNITHAYAITIHKSQGSEFDHIIMPITSSYNRMLYNKLLYTGVSRAKKSLVLIGEYNAFLKSINNNYSYLRKTTLKEKIENI